MISRRDFFRVSLASGVFALVALTGCSSSAASASASSASAAVSSSAAAPAAAAVVCFSCTGNTWGVALKIAAAAQADLVRLEAARPYSADDLNYSGDCRANQEQNGGTARPEIAGGIPDLAKYDTIYLGYPIWWGKAPRIILTLLEGASFAGKKIVPFCTSGSSPIDGSLEELKSSATGATVESGKRFTTDASDAEIKSFL